MKHYKIFMVMIIGTFIAGNVFSQEQKNSVPGNGLSSFGVNAGLNLTPYQSESPGNDQWNPWAAGWFNTLGGAWSWSHNDVFGGALTAGLEAGGIVLWIAYFAVASNPPVGSLIDIDSASSGYAKWKAWSNTTALLGVSAPIVFTGGVVFGLLRGYFECKDQNNAANVAEGFSGNPLKHTSFAIVPSIDGKGLDAAFTYKTSF